MNHWYLDWFNEDYLALYRHRNQTEAKQQVEFIIQELPEMATTDPFLEGPVLDVACGAGRHLRALANSGIWAVGIDTSSVLLGEAGAGLDRVRGDMSALPVLSGCVPLVISMFTSFGYFPRDEDNQRALGEWHRALKPQGYLVIDFFNAAVVVRNLVAFSETQEGPQTVIQERSLSKDGLRVEKRIRISTADALTTTPKEFFESVRLFSRNDLHRLLEQAKFKVEKEFGDFDGAAWNEDSPRLIIFARKSE